MVFPSPSLSATSIDSRLHLPVRRLRGFAPARPSPCCATPAASPWPIRGRIQGSFKTISATGISSTPCATPPPIRPGLRSYGGREEKTKAQKEERQIAV